ncbi:hypothetical protein K1X84_03925 [bacterium]|nr:hypothetical protein [bacterium]
MKRQWLIVWILIVLILENLPAQTIQSKNDYFTIVSEKDGELVYEFNFNRPSISSFLKNGTTYDQLEVPFFELTQEDGAPLLPKISYLLELPEGQPQAQVIHSQKEWLSIGQVFYQNYSEKKTLPDEWLPKNYTRLDYVGKMRNIPMYQLTIYPYRYNASKKQIEFNKQLQIKITYQASQRVQVTESRIDEVDQLLKSNSLNYEFARKKRQLKSKATLNKTAVQSSLMQTAQASGFYNILGSPHIKIIVDTDGLYKIPYSYLVEETGMNFKNIDPRTFRLFNQGLEVPIYFQGDFDGQFNEGDFFEFFGEKYLAKFNRYINSIPKIKGHYIDPWSDDNAYFLTWGGNFGLRMVEENGGKVEAVNLNRPSNFNFIAHYETDRTRLSIKDINLIQPTAVEDIWAYDEGISYIQGGTGETSSREYSFIVEQPEKSLPSTFSLLINLQGVSTGSHLVSILLNDVEISGGNLSWTGPEKFQTEILINYLLIDTGVNRLRITTPSSADRTLDILALNWFELKYKRTYRVQKDYLLFYPSSDGVAGYTNQFTIRAFKDPNISIYKKGVSKIVNWDLRRIVTDNTWNVEFQDLSPLSNTEYVAVSETAKLLPKSATLNTSTNTLLTESHNARYLIITPKRFKNAVLPLQTFRASKGLPVETIAVEDIYDAFGFGVKSPYAIRDFLRYTYTQSNWQGAQGSPLYILLVGDASENSKNTADILPTQHIQTEKYGSTASDYWYSLADDDDIVQDFFIGRFPVSDSVTIQTITDKIIQYEQSVLPGAWKNTVQFIGGQNESRGVLSNNSEIPVDVFRYQSSKLINNTMPQAFSPKRIYAFPRNDQFIGGANDVISSFNDGRLIVTYLGHGGGGIWGDLDAVTGKPLLNNDQVDEISNQGNRYPFVLSMTCFVGAFDGGNPALGEVMLTKPNKGAIGVLASSGTGWIIGDFQMLEQSLQSFLQEGVSVGAAVAQGKINYLILKGQTDVEVSGSGSSLTQSFIAPSMAFQFNYLGDPALMLKTPKKKSFTVSNYSPQKSETITINGTPDFQSGSGTIEVFQSKPVIDSVQNGANLPSIITLYSAPFTITNGTYNFGLNLSAIPAEQLSEGITGLRVFGESSDGTSSFNAQASIAINATYMDQIQTVPASLTSSDTVRFKLLATDPEGVSSVVVLYDRFGTITETGLIDTLYSIGSNYFQSLGSGPFQENDLIRYRIKVKDQNGDSTLSSQYEFRILPGIDLSLGFFPDLNDLATTRIFLGGTDQTKILAEIDNLGVLPLSNVKVQFYDGDPRTTGVLLSETTVTLDGSVPNANQIAKDTASVISALSNGAHQVFAWIDPDSSVNDIDRSNNLAYAPIILNRFNITPSLGSTYSGTKNDTVSIDSGLFISVPPNGVAQNTVLGLTSTTSISLTNQPDLQLAVPYNLTLPTAYQLDFKKASEVFSSGKSLLVMFHYDTARYKDQLNYRDSLAVYRWDSGNKRWKLVSKDTRGISGFITIEITSVNDVGLLALMINRDYTPPVIEATVEGQFFAQNSIVPRNPKIAALLSDQNGVNLDPSTIVVLVDNQPVNEGDLVVPDSLNNSNSVAITLNRREFDPGAHTITFQAKDISGNTSAPFELNFKVVAKMDIKLMGNFPNPFANTTTFVFRVEAFEQLDNLEISIYTVSGKRIRKITPDDVGNQVLNAIGYHEVVWDATDDKGNNIANGIYFYLIKGKLNGKTIERKGKLAFFR